LHGDCRKDGITLPLGSCSFEQTKENLMTIAYWCVLAAIFLPYLATSLAKFQGGFGPKQNHNPR
tara:strand:- start:477 stop:668 length:192 start_codon:yes stop_codon:yes gene_type:complete